MKKLLFAYCLIFIVSISHAQQQVWDNQASYQIRVSASINNQFFYFMDDSPGNSGLAVNKSNQNGTPFFHRFDQIAGMTVFNSKVFFVGAIDGDVNLWVSDGTMAGTIQLTFFEDSYTGSIAVFNNKVYFVNLAQIWYTDGTLNGTQKVLEISPIEGFISDLVGLNNKLFYYYNGQLGVTDGVASTVEFLSDKNTSDIIINIEGEFMVLNNKLYFITRTDDDGRELWCTDGTNENTGMFIDIRPGAEDAFEVPYHSGGPDPYFTASNGKFYFVANKGTGKSVWVTDGTISGTSELYIGANGVTPVSLKSIDGNIYFSNNYSYGFYFSDGKNNTVQNIGGSSNPFDAYSFIKYKDSVYFVASDTYHGYELWKTGNTPESTTLVSDICSGSCSSFNHYTGLAVCDNALFFSASQIYEPGYGSNYQLWRLTSLADPINTTATIKSSVPITKTYPNPCEDYITVELSEVPVSVKLISASGLTYNAAWRYETNQAIVSTQDLMPGMYKLLIDGYEPVSVIKK